MLKVAGWIVSASAVDDWRQAHPKLERQHSVFGTRLRVVAMLKERIHEGLEPLPVLEEQIISIAWPKMTKEARGKSVCLLVRSVTFDAKNETWNNFTPILEKSPDTDKVFNALASDGLKLGEWVTVPDPFEEEWPFARRYPGARCPPEPVLERLYIGPLRVEPSSIAHYR